MIEIKSAFLLQELNSNYDICLHYFQGIASYFKIPFRAFFAFNFAAVSKFTIAINPLVTLYVFKSQVTAIV